ncbi:HIT family protein [Sphingomonas sp. GCM10030256]|uniref:HIT family protein n=1 Tax=Sphingomonas sp. GCM10030256 TaxID=3273427 RepID=UPI00361D614F
MTKFGYPQNLLREGSHWALLVRPQQVTLGSLVLCSLSEVRSYADLPVEAFAEQREMVAAAEALLREFVGFERINYLMLMMVDPHVHFHVLPRYEGSRSFNGQAYSDSGWPGLPDLANCIASPGALVARLKAAIGAAT